MIRRVHNVALLPRTPQRDIIAMRARREQATPIFVGAKVIPIAIEKPRAQPVDYRPLIALCALVLVVLTLSSTGLLNDAELYRYSHGGR